MCRQCARETLPERGRVCLDSGAYLLNWAGCASCGAKDAPRAADRAVEEEEIDDDHDDDHFAANVDGALAGETPSDGPSGSEPAPSGEPKGFEEITTYRHVCAKCDHFVCEHYHKFVSTNTTQEFIMSCVLCGRGSEEKMLFEEPKGGESAKDARDVEAASVQDSRPAPAQVTAGLAARISAVQLHENESDSGHDDWED
ncbi:Protein Churchill [Hondaea fermentalgiana]|uniref:Protein Churchill n=1 Tax=Hondaea fermentalgiana TaxID=2315210 RepID=A0A2R5GCX1_9STRA|nr:Protein Churchill [Hondaea fermentalgiana]|eukprot:GBG28822.1 Protein Churchill [Hondaea fermentalgiana]